MFLSRILRISDKSILFNKILTMYSLKFLYDMSNFMTTNYNYLVM